jgi:hypothetical protein
VSIDKGPRTARGLLAFVEHAIESAHTEQAAFAEAAASDVEHAISWSAEGALVAVFTERHAKTVLDQLKLGRDLQPIYQNLIDRLVMLACGSHQVQAEMRAIANLAKSLKGWL